MQKDKILTPGKYIIEGVEVEILSPVSKRAIENTIRIMKEREGEYI